MSSPTLAVTPIAPKDSSSQPNHSCKKGGKVVDVDEANASDSLRVVTFPRLSPSGSCLVEPMTFAEASALLPSCCETTRLTMLIPVSSGRGKQVV